MSEQKQVSDNLLMTTWLRDHDCTFTWRLRNLSYLVSRKEGVQQVFTLHPECDNEWKLTAKASPTGLWLELNTVSYGRRLAPESYIGVNLNSKGEFDKSETQLIPQSYSIDYNLTFRKGKITTHSDKVVELEDDTLEVIGRLVVPSCCPKTEIDKEEDTKQLDLCKLMKEELVVA